MLAYFFNRPLPPGLEGLADLALDLRWTWSHFSDRLWETLDRDAWERTGNPYFILQSVSQGRLDEAAKDAGFKEELQKWLAERQRYLQDPGWYGRQRADGLKTVAYFSMEFGLGEALPVYSGGLGILAGDYLKTASDLGVPVVGVGLLYQQGYFRQILDPDGRQQEVFPYNDPTSLPVTPVPNREGGWLRIRLELPGRPILVRVWQAQVGRTTLYLLDSNDLLNSPADRGATALLYPSGIRPRLTQEIILGIAGWQVLEELGLDERGARRFCGARACPQLYAPDGTAVLCGALGNQGRQCVYDPYARRSGVRPISTRTDSSPCDIPRGADACTDSRSSRVGAEGSRQR